MCDFWRPGFKLCPYRLLNTRIECTISRCRANCSQTKKVIHCLFKIAIEQGIVRRADKVNRLNSKDNLIASYPKLLTYTKMMPIVIMMLISILWLVESAVRKMTNKKIKYNMKILCVVMQLYSSCSELLYR